MSLALSRLSAVLESKKLAHTLTKEGFVGVPANDIKVMSSGIDALDRVLGGGWRAGELSEVIGTKSTGRTGVLVSTMAAATQRGAVVGLVDTLDRFDPVTAAAAGLDLDRVLWVRGATLMVEQAKPALIEHAVRQAVRALDLIVRAGGFGVAVLDLADVPARSVRAVPLTTWLRIAHANEGRETACLLVGEAPMGRSARGVTARLQATRLWTGDSAQRRRFAGFEIHAQISSARVGPAGAEARWR